MQERYKIALLFGAPGVGKGTQGQLLHQIGGFFHFAAGDMFRSIDKHSELGRVFHEYSSRGELVPDDLTVRLWLQHLRAHTVLGHYQPSRDLLLLDGIPRTVSQAGLIAEHVDVLKVVHLVCHDQEAMVHRLKRRATIQGRHDDADEDVIRRRWQVYEANTRPVLDTYPPELIAEVDAIGSLPTVLRNSLDVLAPLHEAHFAASA